MISKCPTCNNQVKSDNKHLPFCSERCRLIDLGDWLAGNYSVVEQDHPETWIESENSDTRH
ncbi:MAG: DNA gyrase inhibitor YacG [Gammaproteobacteria bacterium]|nr:DNA gyrase inhibitor YacG [Gammaproteobacteria bacterium]